MGARTIGPIHDVCVKVKKNGKELRHNDEIRGTKTKY